MRAIIFGGTGQIGRALRAELERGGWHVTVPTRSVHSAAADGRIPFSMEAGDLESAMTDMDLVVNCVGILAPSGADTFDRIHRDLPERIARAAAKKGITRVVHISALGADANSASVYARSKAQGEAAVLAAYPHASILRPSIVFGPDDSFFNRFAQMAKLSPFLPLIGGGVSKFQPVYVNDVVLAVWRIVLMKEGYDRIFNLGGPDMFTFKELMQFILETTRKKRILLPLPWWIAEIQASLLERLPGKILTRDQLKLLRTDNIVPPASIGFDDLGIVPRRVADIVPGYLKA
ncbi:MAG: complex I NDUFA9 subunit family protein [Alphaproteobacteria bacterium]|nr:complex I NDUFA9 subunit family protein [Alphaproteobacteria bacterium]